MGCFFLEETSLALAPAVPEAELKQRLEQRLAKAGNAITEVMDVEHCLFPMNLPLPDFHQPVLAFGGAASMVHPASGYMVGALLRRGPGLANALAAALKEQPAMGSAALARVGWQALWPTELVWRHRLFQFGLGRLMDFDERLLRRPLHQLFSAIARRLEWLPHQHVALAAADGSDAAPVCDLTLGCAERVGAGCTALRQTMGFCSR
jgi:lycopene beta-cyclase